MKLILNYTDEKAIKRHQKIAKVDFILTGRFVGKTKLERRNDTLLPLLSFCQYERAKN